MLNKPSGYITACKDAGRKTVMELFKDDVRERLHPIGRLDMDTTGLLLFTDDGSIDNALMQPEKHVEKEYRFLAIGDIDSEKIYRLENGLDIGKGSITRKAAFTLEEKTGISEIAGYLPEKRKRKYLKNPNGSAFWGRLTVCEGKKHQVKLMLGAVHCKIVKLERIRIGSLVMDRDLPLGAYRKLTVDETEKLIYG